MSTVYATAQTLPARQAMLHRSATGQQKKGCKTMEIIKQQGSNMNADWNRSSQVLPSEGQQIEFLLDHRNVVMEGTYNRQAFHSNWAEYTVDRVRSWRDLGPAYRRQLPMEKEDTRAF